VTLTPYDDAIADALEAVEKHEAGLASDPAPLLLEADPLGEQLARATRDLAAAEERFRQAEEQLAAAREQRVRDAADLDNYRKRILREKEEAERYANERLVKEVLPVLDSLDRALAAAGDHPLRIGIEMTRRLFEDALARFGVKGFSAKGETFDPHRHEAIVSVATAAHPPGTVLEEQQRGFVMHDRLIRPALVMVAGPPAEGC
jgi:molecular chaperone GrpE